MVRKVVRIWRQVRAPQAQPSVCWGTGREVWGSGEGGRAREPEDRGYRAWRARVEAVAMRLIGGGCVVRELRVQRVAPSVEAAMKW